MMDDKALEVRAFEFCEKSGCLHGASLTTLLREVADEAVEAHIDGCGRTTYNLAKSAERAEAEVERLKETDRASFRAWEKSEAEVARLRAALLKRGLSPAPCDICGYNGPGYHQSNTHICAALREISLLEDDPLRASKTRSIIARAALRGEGEK